MILVGELQSTIECLRIKLKQIYLIARTYYKESLIAFYRTLLKKYIAKFKFYSCKYIIAIPLLKRIYLNNFQLNFSFL